MSDAISDETAAVAAAVVAGWSPATTSPDQPYTYRPYPKVKYHAHEPARVVTSADAEAALGELWCDAPDDAKRAMQDHEMHLGTRAAERLYRDRTMSDAAKAEALAADRAVPEHLPEIPEAPKKRRTKVSA